MGRPGLFYRGISTTVVNFYYSSFELDYIKSLELNFNLLEIQDIEKQVNWHQNKIQKVEQNLRKLVPLFCFFSGSVKKTCSLNQRDLTGITTKGYEDSGLDKPAVLYILKNLGKFQYG